MRRKLIEHWLKTKGLTIAPLNGPSFSAALERLNKRGIALQTIIDVGASNGCWSERLLRCYPQARYLCVEAQPGHEAALQKFTARHPNVEYVLAAAGEKEGQIFFNAADLFGGVASYQPVGKNGITVPVTTLDAEVARRGLKPPFLIKLDTHGFEVPILTGAARTMELAEALVIEAYNFKITPETLLFHELCAYLAQRGFRCIDMFDPLYRPHDDALWQMDLVFVRADRPEFQHLAYA